MGDQRLEPCHRTCVAVAVHRAQFGSAPLPGRHPGHVEHWVEQRLAHHAVRRNLAPVRGRRGRRNQPGDARVGLGGGTDEVVRFLRRREFAGEEGAEGCSGDPPDDLADQVAEGHRVVSRAVAWTPPGLLRREQLSGPLHVADVIHRDPGLPAGQAGGVPEKVPDEHVRLARRRELGPVPRHRRVGVELTPLDQDQGDQRDHGLGDRERVHDRVALPRRAGLLVRDATPQVDDDVTIEDHAQRHPGIVALVDALLNQRADRLEPRRDRAIHAHNTRTRSISRPVIRSAVIMVNVTVTAIEGGDRYGQQDRRRQHAGYGRVMRVMRRGKSVRSGRTASAPASRRAAVLSRPLATARQRAPPILAAATSERASAM
jgi:hypothetical protein